MKRATSIALFLMVGSGALFCAPTARAAAGTVSPAKYNVQAVLQKAPGGNIAPCREISDPYPEYNGIALDPTHHLISLSDTNLKSLLTYDLTQVGSDSSNPTPTRGWVKGPATYISYAAGVAFDPARRVVCVTENDVGDDVACFPDDANGDYHARVLAVPHGAYGLAFNQRLKQMVVSVEHNAQLIFYRSGATGAELPLRAIRGPHTEMADPHGLYWDDAHQEIGVVNHGNSSPGYWDMDYTGGGRYQPPSITIFSDRGKGDVKPLRVIQGANTQLDWPSGIAVDPVHNEIAVANTAGGSVLIFSRTAQGDVKPLRVISGPHSGIYIPMGVAFDPNHDSLWVANFGHTALEFSRTAEGDVAPIGVLRNAPKATPAVRFGNPFTIAYDSKRDELIVPN